MKHLKLLLTLLICLHIPLTYAKGKLQEGVDALNKKNYKKAASLFRPLAKKGNIEAEFYLGKALYMRGPSYYYVAHSWLIKPAEQGNPGAQYYVGKVYDWGTFVKDYNYKSGYKIAREWYRKAAAQGYSDAYYALGRHYSGKKRDLEEAAKWYQLAADAGDKFAQYELARMYYQENGVELDYSKACLLYKKSAEQDFADSQYELAKCYYHGDGFNKDMKKVLFWTRKAAILGNKDAKKALKELESLKELDIK